jgi:cytoskeletal protein RodZ
MHSQQRAWRMIVMTALAAFLCWGVSVVMLSAVAQDSAPPSATAETNEAEDVRRRAAPPKTSDEESPEYRDSADNNISLPIDI